MGYTHYFEQLRPLTENEFSELVKVTKRIIKLANDDGIEICDGNGNGEPIITDELIQLNGSSHNDNDHETFMIQRDKKYGDFCKTARKPYDAVVVSILHYMKHCISDAYDISSDGDDIVIDCPIYDYREVK